MTLLKQYRLFHFAVENQNKHLAKDARDPPQKRRPDGNFNISPRYIKIGTKRGWVIDFAQCLQLTEYQFANLLYKVEAKCTGALFGMQQKEELEPQVATFETGELVFDLGLTPFQRK